MAKAIAVAEETTNSGLERLKAGPARLGAFLTDVRAEMKKVVSPSRAEVQATTIVVIVTVFVFAAYFGAVDFLVGHLMDFIFKHLAK
jgi:preprotein translocase subunit SecE